MIILETKESKDTEYYLLDITGEIDLESCNHSHEHRTVKIPSADWKDVDALFFMYVGTYANCFTTWNKNHKDDVCFGKHFKKNPIFNQYLGFWAQGEFDDPITLSWDSIQNVKIQWVDKNHTLYDIVLPNIEKLYKTEQDFADAFKKAAEERAVELADKARGEVKPWELSKAKHILKLFGWKDEQLENLFYGYCENGFNEIAVNPEESFAYSIIVNKICKLEKATSGTNCYKRFKKETLSVLEKAIMDCNGITDESKKFAVDVLRKYNSEYILEDWEKKSLKDMAFRAFKQNDYGNVTSTNGYSGVHLEEFDSYEDMYARSYDIKSEEDLEYLDEDNFRECDGKLYILSEAD